MPELPEVEVLVRHLQPLLRNQTIQRVEVRRARIAAPTSPLQLRRTLTGARFRQISRRGKYLLFDLTLSGGKNQALLGHLGMTGRMYLQPRQAPLPKHAAVVLGLADRNFIFEDTRYFGRFTLDLKPLDRLGPEPLAAEFDIQRFTDALKHSRQPIKVKLLDQSLVAGVGNIYAGEALFLAQIAPTLPARSLTRAQLGRLYPAICQVLSTAIQTGSTIPLDFAGSGARDGLFYYGSEPETAIEERFRVYDRAGQPCSVCGTMIERIVQAARSTFYCPRCQRRR